MIDREMLPEDKMKNRIKVMMTLAGVVLLTAFFLYTSTLASDVQEKINLSDLSKKEYINRYEAKDYLISGVTIPNTDIDVVVQDKEGQTLEFIIDSGVTGNFEEGINLETLSDGLLKVSISVERGCTEKLGDPSSKIGKKAAKDCKNKAQKSLQIFKDTVAPIAPQEFVNRSIIDGFASNTPFSIVGKSIEFENAIEIRAYNLEIGINAGVVDKCNTYISKDLTWECNFPHPFSEGTYILEVQEFDKSMNSSTVSTTNSVYVDKYRPDPPEIYSPVTGPVDTQTPIIRGGGLEPGAVVIVKELGYNKTYCSATANLRGVWSCQVSPLEPGRNTLSVLVVADEAGNVGIPNDLLLIAPEY